MNRRTLKHSREELIRQALAVIGTDADSKLVYAATIMLFYLKVKISLSELSEVGISAEEANTWGRKACRQGIDALRARLLAGSRVGRPGVLAPRQPNEHKLRRSSLACAKREK